MSPHERIRAVAGGKDSCGSRGIIDLAALLKSFLLKFAQACKNGWKALQKFFEDLLNIGKKQEPKEKVIDEVLVVVPAKKKANQ